jgi:hypothetical protein
MSDTELESVTNEEVEIPLAIVVTFKAADALYYDKISDVVEAVKENLKDKDIAHLNAYLTQKNVAERVMAIVAPPTEEESNLIRHARQELEHIGCDEESIQEVLSIIQVYVGLGMSGGQASWLIPIVNDLVQFKNLTPLSDDPKEWVQHEETLWQNKRHSAAFSDNNGRTYWLVDDPIDPISNSRTRYPSAMVKHARAQ